MTPAGPDHDRDFAARLQRSVARGVITREQADRILAEEAPTGLPNPAAATASGDPGVADATTTARPGSTDTSTPAGAGAADTARAAGPGTDETAIAAELGATDIRMTAEAEPSGTTTAARSGGAEAGGTDTPRSGGPTVRGPIVAEALGYVGGVLVLIGAVTIALTYWGEMGIAGRLAVLFGAAGVLLIAGTAVPARRVQAAHRLRSVCWLLSVVLFGAGVSLLAQDVFRLDDHTGLLSTGCAAVFAGVLWWLHRTVPLQAITVFALAMTASSAVYLLPNGFEYLPGLAVWGLGVGWLLLAEGGVIAARRAGTVLGGAAAVISSLFTIGVGWGAVLAIGTAVTLVATGVWLRNLVLLTLGAVAVLLSVPIVVGQYFPNALVVSLALLGCGVLLVAGGIVTARRGRIRPSEPGRIALGRVPAIGAAACVVIIVTIAVLLLGR